MGAAADLGIKAVALFPATDPSKKTDDAREALAQSGADGVMIGRAALHNPFIFRDIHAYMNGEVHIENESSR